MTSALHRTPRKRALLFSSQLTVLATFLLMINCAPEKREAGLSPYEDTTVAVYGQYRVLKLPIEKGVKIANPIQLSLGPGGVMFAANASGEVYSLQDTDNDGLEDTNLLYCDVREYGLRSPSGFAYRGDTIYIGTAQQIRAFRDKDKDGRADTSWVFFDDIPNSEHPYEWTCGLTFGADGSLYLALSTDSWNAGASPDPKGYRGSILKVSPDGKAETIATGIRSVYGMAFDPDGDLYFVDNEGGGNAKEELNRFIPSAFYGHNPKKYTFDSITGPVLELNTEMAPSDIAFNKAENDFGGTGGQLFVSFYGPGERWNRGSVARIIMKENGDGKTSFEEIPVADIPKLSNLAFGTDGSLYLAQHGKADYWYNVVYENEGHFYKLVYDATIPGTRERPQMVTASLSVSSVEKGKQIFAEAACLGCHAVDGATELLGPNLQDIGKQLSREEIMDEIMNPSARIKPSMLGVRIRKKNGQVLMGRVVSSGNDELSVMLVGNQVVQVKRDEIEATENQTKSLMYEGLISRLSAEDRQSLIDYIVSLSDR